MEIVPLREEHVYDFLNWRDHEDPLYQMYNFCETEETVGDWYLWKTQNPKDRYFSILVRGVAVGYMGLKNLSRDGKTAEVGIILGGGETGRGIGGEALSKLLDYGFGEIGLETIALEVLPWNDRARKLYEKLGFRLVKRLYRPVDLPQEAPSTDAFSKYRDKMRVGKHFSAVLVDRMELRKGEWECGI
ncbi:MAG: GNAT family N-acetyltransferase [Peptoniphilus sp.]|nr:GNAT family N-acetyltransferase [Peptoniphilus sp.]MDD7362887.1 GNAT family N-acetyltransferase [Bacillota bacterium]MDY6044872.1 GNAT family N-acetyltransferase [Peptoniphilus sp.]